MRAPVWFIAVLIAALPVAGAAASKTEPDAAAQFLSALGTETIRVLRAEDTPLELREIQVRTLLGKSFDFETIGRFVMGRAWGKATPGQRSEYQALFQEYVLRTYSRRIGGYSGESFRIVKAEPLGKTDALVFTEIGRPSGPPLLAGWRVRNRDGGHKILDVVVEGISMAQTQRSEFAALIRRQGIDGLLEALRARVQKYGARSS